MTEDYLYRRVFLHLMFQFESEPEAGRAYSAAASILNSHDSIEDSFYHTYALAFDKIVTLINYRDNGMYIKTPIYLEASEAYMFIFIGDTGAVIQCFVLFCCGVNSLQHRYIVSLSCIFWYCLLKHLYNCSIFVIDLIYEIYYTI